MDALELDLAKIRGHTKSNLDHQKRPAVLLNAVEATLDAQKMDRKPVAYFAALVSTMIQLAEAFDKANDDDPNLISNLYLLALVVPHTPAPVLRTKHRELLDAVVPVLLAGKDVGMFKSCFKILAKLFISLQTAELSKTADYYKLIFNQYVLDSRPKLRKACHDFTFEILSNPPKPSIVHPYTLVTIQHALTLLEDQYKSAIKGKTEQDLSKSIAICSLIKQLGSLWPAQEIGRLCTILLKLPKLGNPYLSTSAFNILEQLFTTTSDSFQQGSIQDTLAAVLECRPNTKDQLIVPGWLGSVEHGFVAFAKVSPVECSTILYSNFSGIFDMLASDPSPAVQAAAYSCLSAMIRYCIRDANIRTAVAATSNTKISPSDDPLSAILKLLKTALTGIKYRSAIKQSLELLATLANKLKLRELLPTGQRSDTAAASLLKEHAEIVGNLRADTNFEHKDSAENVLGALSLVCGPEWVLTILPLNIDLSNRSKQGRAWLLPIFKSHISNTSLSHFATFFVPMSESLFTRKVEAEKAGGSREVEKQVCDALIGQIWALFPGYCDVATDVSQAFTKDLCSIIANILYTQPTLRPFIVRGLQLLVIKTTTVATSTAPPETLKLSFGINQTDATKDAATLKAAAPGLLAVLFNVFAGVSTGEEGFMKECIGTWISLLSPQEVHETFNKINGLIASASATKSTGKPDHKQSKTMSTMLDLLLCLIPYASTETAEAVYNLVLSDEIIARPDAGVQKKAYKSLIKLAEAPAGSVLVNNKLAALLNTLNEKGFNVIGAAKRDRTALLALLVPRIPSDSLHLLPPIISEAVLATKESNEKTREASFDLLVNMGDKMSKGGLIKRSLISGMEVDADEEEMADAPASLEEYVTMVAAGLAGSSTHMISATITALSRLLFEYHAKLSSDTINELLLTLLVFLSSANREVVKSAIGFFKVSIVSLSTATLEAHLSTLVPALLNWSREHRNHFKLNIRHIFERLIRRFSYDKIVACAPVGEEGDEGRKVLAAINKRQKRAKRKKDTKPVDGMDSDAEAQSRIPTASRNAYEDALYGSEASDSDSDSDAAPAGNRKTKALPRQRNQRIGDRKQDKVGTSYIRGDDDEPMDLLDSKIVSKISGANPEIDAGKRAKRMQQGSKYKQDDSGKMIIDAEDGDDAAGRRKTKMEREFDDEIDSSNAYLEAITGEDGFQRDATGRVKFNKKGGKRGRNEFEDELREMGDQIEAIQVGKKKKQKQQKEQAGSEFKAKRAGGDVKKGGVTPYAYVPLAKAGGRHKSLPQMVAKSGSGSKSKGGRK